MLWLVIGVLTAFNLLIFKIKFEQGRYGDLLYDVSTFLVLNVIFGGTLGGMIVAMVASGIISVYLYFNPPKKSFGSFIEEIIEKIKGEKNGLF